MNAEQDQAKVGGARRAFTELTEQAAEGGGIGAVAMGLAFAVLMGGNHQSGYGTAVDMLLEALVVASLMAGLGFGARALAKQTKAFPQTTFLGIAGALGLLAAYQLAKGGLPLGSTLLIQLTLAFIGLRFLPWTLPAALIAAVGALSLRSQLTVGEWYVAPPLIYAQTVIGALIGLGVRRRAKQPAAWLFVVVAFAIQIGGAVVMASPGTDTHLIPPETITMGRAPDLGLPDPSTRGPYAVGSLVYGSGTDIRRPEYGPTVTLKTPVVDASPMVGFINGWVADSRAEYWGFDTAHFPLNARVHYPVGEGPFPLVVIVHGNFSMAGNSDAGYAYLSEPLASRGFIVVSVDENFLNRAWSGNFGGKEIPARGWFALKHVELFKQWNESPGSPFHGKVDLGHVALVGHSRGGAGVHYAASLVNNGELATLPKGAELSLGQNFRIHAVVGLAPSKMVPISNADYLSLHGAHDSEAAGFFGGSQYEQMRVTDKAYHFKAAVYIYRANHHLFNTRWGTADADPPVGWLVNQAPVNDGAAQRKATLVHLAAFLEASLHGKREYVASFRDHRVARPWLPRDIYVTRFEDTSLKLVSDCEEDGDRATTTLKGGTAVGKGLAAWYEIAVHLRLVGGGVWTRAAFLGFQGIGNGTPGAPSYTLTLPEPSAEEWKLNTESRLAFSIASEDETATSVDLTLEIKTRDGVTGRLPLSEISSVPPALRTKLSKWRWFNNFGTNRPSERVFQSYSMRLGDFLVKAGEGALDPSKIISITFRFDRTGTGNVLVDRVGFEVEAPDMKPSAPR